MSSKNKHDLTAGFEPEDGKVCIRYRDPTTLAWQLGMREIVGGVVTWLDAGGGTIPKPETWQQCDDTCPGAEPVTVCGPVEVMGSLTAVVDSTALIAAFAGEALMVDFADVLAALAGNTAGVDAVEQAVIANTAAVTGLTTLLQSLVDVDCNGDPALRTVNNCDPCKENQKPLGGA